jgi:hypothetical protein
MVIIIEVNSNNAKNDIKLPIINDLFSKHFIIINKINIKTDTINKIKGG